MHGTMKYILILLLCSCSLSLGQTSDTSAAPSKWMVGVSLFYYHPNLDDFNKGYSQLEQTSALMPWNDFKISYMVLPTVVYSLNSKTQIALLAGVSYVEHARGDDKSYYFLWMIGGEYRHIPLTFSVLELPGRLCGVIGGGIIGAKFHRSYDNNIAINTSATNIYINGGASASIDVLTWMGVNVDLRYMFVPTKKFDTLKGDLSLKSVMAGIGVFCSL